MVIAPIDGFNKFLNLFGIEPKWYTDTTILAGFKWGSIEFGLPVAIIAVVIAAVWQMTGFSLAMYLAGLRVLMMNYVRPPEWMELLSFKCTGK